MFPFLHLQDEPDISIQDNLDYSLFLAAIDGSLEMTKYLLSVGANPNADVVNYWGGLQRTPLMAAANYLHFDIYEELIKNGDNFCSKFSTREKQHLLLGGDENHASFVIGGNGTSLTALSYPFCCGRAEFFRWRLLEWNKSETDASRSELELKLKSRCIISLRMTE